jgi:hypothetical protein
MQKNNESKWLLIQGKKVLGRIVLNEVDMPWFMCDIQTTMYFEPLRNIFEKFANLHPAKEIEKDGKTEVITNPEWDNLRKLIGSKILLLIPLNKKSSIPGQENILLHIKDGKANFRISSVPNTQGVDEYSYFYCTYLELCFWVHNIFNRKSNKAV